MLNINTDTMLIELTRGDSASIVFSAVNDEGETYTPSVGEKIKFAVAKKWGADPLMKIENTGDSENIREVTLYEEASPTQEEYEADPTEYYYKDLNDEYVQCTADVPWDEDTQYYTQKTIIDATDFWTITIETDDWLDDSGNDAFNFSDYVWDCQILTSTGAQTIIGKTDDLNPTFRVLGEVAEE